MPTTVRRRAGNSAAHSASMAIDGRLAEALEHAASWLPDSLAMVLGGSHASGEAVWIRTVRGEVCLSDIDLYAVFAAEPERAASADRAASAMPGLELRLAQLGFLGPLELGLHTRSEWERLPARPATLELRRHGRVIHGDESAREWLPDYRPGDVPAEEILLLLENRGFELLKARWPLRSDDPFAALRRRHSVYKTALDLAAVADLRSGRWEDGAEARVRVARDLASRAVEEPPWDSALAWRRGVVPDDDEAERDWWRTSRAWVREWRSTAVGTAQGLEFDEIALRAARRARLRRRLRLALRPGPRAGRRAPAVSRLRFAVPGTPQHRLNASAAALLAALVELDTSSARRAEIERRLARVLARLGVVPAGLEVGRAARGLIAAWENWILEAPRETGAGS